MQQLFHFLQVVLPLGKDLPPVAVCKSSVGIQHVHMHSIVVMVGMYLVITNNSFTNLHAYTRANISMCSLIICGFSVIFWGC